MISPTHLRSMSGSGVLLRELLGNAMIDEDAEDVKDDGANDTDAYEIRVIDDDLVDDDNDDTDSSSDYDTYSDSEWDECDDGDDDKENVKDCWSLKRKKLKVESKENTKDDLIVRGAIGRSLYCTPPRKSRSGARKSFFSTPPQVTPSLVELRAAAAAAAKVMAISPLKTKKRTNGKLIFDDESHLKSNEKLITQVLADSSHRLAAYAAESPTNGSSDSSLSPEAPAFVSTLTADDTPNSMVDSLEWGMPNICLFACFCLISDCDKHPQHRRWYFMGSRYDALEET